MAYVSYASDVGSLMCAMVSTRPNITHAVRVWSRYMSTRGREHWTYVKRVFWYLFGTIDYAICYQGKSRFEKQVHIHVFVDFDWARNVSC